VHKGAEDMTNRDKSDKTQASLHNKRASLSEVNRSITVTQSRSFWRNFFTFSGPGALVAVGYMDPGNWITSVVGGATYKYALLSVILLSSLVAMQLQHMCGKLGLVTHQDLAQHLAARSPKWLRWILFVVIEIILLGLMHLGFRKIEAVVSALIFTIVVIFGYLVALSGPDFGDIMRGYIPNPGTFMNGKDSATILALSLGIIGATVMPHNLYLHSSIVQTRDVDSRNEQELDKAVRFMTLDSNVQLSMAFVVNSLLLILGASVFYGHAQDVMAFEQMYNALANPHIAGVIASKFVATLFAVALLASGQNSTITGTLTGQIVLEGFMHIKAPQWIIRLLTRAITLVPVIVVAVLSNGSEHSLDDLIVYSQVFLSLALPFSIYPLIYFTSKKSIMGRYANARWNTILGYVVATVLTILNLQLIVSVVM